jgi:hypothetical protein
MTAARKANGQFKKGKSGNPKGRPKKAREDRYFEITMTKCTFKEWGAIVQKAVDQAQRGDATARKWLSDYLIGPPQQRLDVTSGGEVLKGYIGISPDDWDDDED